MDDLAEKWIWPLDEILERDLYFYLPQVEAYLPDCRVVVSGNGEMIMLGGYSYLGLNGHPQIDAAAQVAIETYGTGTHGVRLLAGTLDLHERLEARIAAFKQTESAATFSSGYFANVATIACLIGPRDTVFSDRLNHASIVDGCQLSHATHVRFRHNDMEDLERGLEAHQGRGRQLVVVDAVFSMDGDIANLPEISRLCRQYDACLMVDEAHSIGVLGATGHGIEEHFGLPPEAIDIKMGTLSKAIPSVGGYIAGSRRLCHYIKHHARGFFYSAALPPPAAAAAIAALDVIEAEPERVRRLQENARYFKGRLREVGFTPSASETAILPILCGDNDSAWRLSRHSQKRGIFVQAIPHPVVPKGLARLRAAVCSLHREEDLDFCANTLRDGAEEIGGILSYRPAAAAVCA